MITVVVFTIILFSFHFMIIFNMKRKKKTIGSRKTESQLPFVLFIFGTFS